MAGAAYPLFTDSASAITLGAGETWIAPDGGLGSTLNALISIGSRRFRLGVGTYYLDETVNCVSNMSILGLGSGLTKIASSLFRATALADDPTNNFFSCRGVVDTSY